MTATEPVICLRCGTEGCPALVNRITQTEMGALLIIAADIACSQRIVAEEARYERRRRESMVSRDSTQEKP